MPVALWGTLGDEDVVRLRRNAGGQGEVAARHTTHTQSDKRGKKKRGNMQSKETFKNVCKQANTDDQKI